MLPLFKLLMGGGQKRNSFNHGNGEPAFDKRFDEGKLDQALRILMLEGAEVAIEGGSFVACEEIAIDNMFNALMADVLL